MKDRNQLTEILKQCFNTLNTYGKSPEQLPSIAKLFIMVLGKYPIDAIMNAFGQWLATSSDMPTPADIVKIINPPQEELSAAVYVAIKKRLSEGVVYVTNAEKDYVKAFERQELKKSEAHKSNYFDSQLLDGGQRLRISHLEN